MTQRQAVWWLVLVCLVWGVSFTVVKASLEYVSPLMLLAIRFTLAAAIILGALRGLSQRDLGPGLLLGFLFWAGFAFQTAGLRYTTPSRSAFITILSTPLVPLVVFLIHRLRPGAPTLAAIGLAVAGTYLLTSPSGGLGLNRGDMLTLGCAVLFAGQVVAAGQFAPQMPVPRLLVLELGSTAVLSFASAPLLESPRVVASPALVVMMGFLALTGLWSFRMQLEAQRVLSATHTALVFCLEPIFASLTSYLVLGERLTLVQCLGGALILGALALPSRAPGATPRR